jgi:hypothetical protein
VYLEDESKCALAGLARINAAPAKASAVAGRKMAVPRMRRAYEAIADTCVTDPCQNGDGRGPSHELSGFGP